MTYRIELTRQALKQIESLDPKTRKRVARRIDVLAGNPRPRGCTKLAGDSNAYRIRVGSHRVLYEVDDDKVLVLVVRVGHRREVYRER